MQIIPNGLLCTVVISSLLIPGCRGNNSSPSGEEDPICPSYKAWCNQALIKNACPVTCGGGTTTTTTTAATTTAATWRNWGIWSTCSVTCGSGSQTRIRACSVAGQCSGNPSQSRSCSKPPCSTSGEDPSCTLYKAWCNQARFKNACPVTCGGDPPPASWGNWGHWSTCTLACGGGSQTRSRTCSTYGQCTGSASESRPCNTQSCSGSWGDWSNWTPCSVTCDSGEQNRARTCSAGECDGDSAQSRVCNEPPCPSGWLPWEKWGLCDKACGPGVQRRLRVCPSPNQCSGSKSETKSCNLRSCTTEYAFSQCSRTCGDGIQRKLVGTEYVTKHCKVKDCPEVACLPGSEPRHQNSASCCKKTQTCYRPAVEMRTIYHRIIGGSNSELGEWPWAVYVQQPAGSCGGVLISSKFILTAAHCLYTSFGKPLAPNDVTVRIGLVYLKTPGLKSYAIVNVFIHPDYNYPYHDIALLELKDHIQFTNQIQPLCLPHGEIVPHDTICMTMGWGISFIGSKSVTDILQNVPIKVFDPNVCVDRYSTGYSQATVSHLKGRRGYICAGDLKQQKDSCQGDSGSALACQRCANCGWFVAGLVSYGPNPCANKKEPGVYTSVFYYEQWIYHVTGIPKQYLSC